MPAYLAALCLIAAAVAQVVVIPQLGAGQITVDLVLLLVVAWGIIKGTREGLLWGLIGGLILDVLSVAPFGATMAVLGLIGLVSGSRGLSLLRGSLLLPLLAAGIATLFYDGLMMVLLAPFGRDWRWLDVLRDVVLPAALLNALVMVPVYWLFRWLHRRGEPEFKW